MVKCPPIIKRLLLCKILKELPCRTLQKGQILKDILLLAKLSKRPLHMDTSCVGQLRHRYHSLISQYIVYITAMVSRVIISFFAVQIDDLSYINYSLA